MKRPSHSHASCVELHVCSAGRTAKCVVNIGVAEFQYSVRLMESPTECSRLLRRGVGFLVPCGVVDADGVSISNISRVCSSIVRSR